MSLLQVVPHCEFLRWTPAFLVNRLDQMSGIRIYQPGETLFQEGKANPDFHIVAEGHVRLDMYVHGRGRVPILTTGIGDILGWSALLGKGIMTSSAVALDCVKTITLPGMELQHLCETEHEVGYHVMRQLAAALAKRLVATRLQLLDVFGEHTVIDPVKEANQPPCG